MKNSFERLVVDNKENADHFNQVFSNLGHYFGKITEEGPSFIEGDSSFSFCTISEKDCYDVVNDMKPEKPTGPCKVLAWAVIDGKDILVPHLTFI